MMFEQYSHCNTCFNLTSESVDVGVVQYPLHLYHLQYHQEIREESVYYFIYLRLLAYAVCVFRHEWWH